MACELGGMLTDGLRPWSTNSSFDFIIFQCISSFLAFDKFWYVGILDGLLSSCMFCLSYYAGDKKNGTPKIDRRPIISGKSLTLRPLTH